MFNKEKIKKYVAVSLTVLLLLTHSLFPVFVYADVSPTPTPAPDTSTTNTTPTPTPTPDPTVISPTDTPTPTPTPDPNVASASANSLTPTPTPDPASTTASNSADLTNTVNASSTTGGNSLIATNSATTNSDPTSQSSASTSVSNNSSIQTGNSASVVNAQNSVNSTTINSKVINQTLNIYITQNGNLNLSDPFTVATNAVQTHPNDAVINVSFTNINNYAYITNNISSSANTGNNSINATGQNSTISTGNAYSVVSLLNQVNFNVVNSQVHVVVINIFGTLNGNIILPDPNTSTSCTSCGVNLNTNNNANVANNVNSATDTGNNSANGSINTGNANSVVNNLNLINTNIVGQNTEVLYVNNLGTWNGKFIGWGNLPSQQGGGNLMIFNTLPSGSQTSGCASCNGQTNINNSAFIINNISSSANTGGNSLTGNGLLTTGNAFSAVSLINFINSNFMNSFGFFGFINIFGTWNGNIGGLSNFLALDQQNKNNDNSPPPQTANSNNDSNNNNSTQEQGGLLSLTQTNNVGAYVYPGDTVTFFVKVRNSGNGKVYGVKLNLFLIYKGQVAGGTTFDLGDIPAQTGKNLTTGFVLSKNSPGGVYIARAVVTGNVGPDNHTISANSDSSFTVLNNNVFAKSANNQKPKVSILGSQNRIGNKDLTSKNAIAPYLFLFIAGILAYLIIRFIKQKDYVFALISNKSIKEKLYSFRMFLF